MSDISEQKDSSRQISDYEIMENKKVELYLQNYCTKNLNSARTLIRSMN